MIKNKFKVCKALWKKWNEISQEVFNEIYKDRVCQDIFRHPKAVKIPKEQWETIAWNFSFSAAIYVELALRNVLKKEQQKSLERGVRQYNKGKVTPLDDKYLRSPKKQK